MLKVIIVGTGISGLTSALMLAQSGFSVTMLSYYESIRSASCMAQGGINAAELRENDSVLKHFTETVSGGAWLADQQPVMDMCKFARNIIAMYDRIGVAFNRNADGSPDTRYFGGSKYKRTHYADTTTGAQLLNALDGQVRRYKELWHMRKPLADKKWFSGKMWAGDFVQAAGFPKILAGVPTDIEASKSSVEYVEPKRKVPQLIEYQKEIKDKLLRI